MMSLRTASRAGAAVVVAALSVGVAHADCNSDLAALGKTRQGYMDKLNVLAKSAKGKLDPVASCPTLRGLVAAEQKLIKYLEANKNWCNVPDEVVANLKTNDAKSQSFATQACNLAVQVKKQQQQAASGGGGLGVETQKLPAGPL